MKRYLWLIVCVTLGSNLLFAQKPTLDEDGNNVYRESKLPIDWADRESRGYKVAIDKVKPILDDDSEEYAEFVETFLARDWSDVLLVTDWTGSMFDYAPQMLRWHLNHRSAMQIKHLVLFNDGDELSTSQKVVGQTGGIYYINNPNDEYAVLNTIAEVVDNGGGGDSPENDLEAVIRAVQRYDLGGETGKPLGFEKLVLIADGDAKVRDLSLLPQIKYPVHVVMCRGTYAIKDYLEIAWQTKGSIIYISEFIDFATANKPTATIAGRTYERQSSGKWKRM